MTAFVRSKKLRPKQTDSFSFLDFTRKTKRPALGWPLATPPKGIQGNRIGGGSRFILLKLDLQAATGIEPMNRGFADRMDHASPNIAEYYHPF